MKRLILAAIHLAHKNNASPVWNILDWYEGSLKRAGIIFKASFLTSFSLVSFTGAVLANDKMIECFEDGLCVDFNSFEFVISKIGGAPKYEVSRFRGTQTYENGTYETIMEIDCLEQQFRTVKIREGSHWNNFDPRWGLRLDDHDPLLNMACSDRD